MNCFRKLASGGEMKPSFITWYTRLWHEIHRDEIGFFRNIKIAEDLFQQYISTFETPKGTSVLLRSNKKLSALYSGAVGAMVMNSQDNKYLFGSFPGRVEAIQAVDISKYGLQNSQFDKVVQETVEKTVSWLTDRNLYSTTFMERRDIKLVRQEVQHWFPYFAGTINRMAHKVLHLREHVNDLNGGKVSPKLIVSFEDILALKAGKYITEYVM